MNLLQRFFFLGIVTFLVLMEVGKLCAQQTPKKPNIIIIMADDLDSKQLSCYGGKNIRTNHLDALAAEGIQTQIYASTAMCVPTRASLFTGLYPVRHGSFQNHKQVNEGLKSVVHYLNNLGYRVGLTGKDHVTKPKLIFPFDIVKGFEPNCVAPTDDYELDHVKKYITQDKTPYCLFVMSINPHAPWTVGDTTEFDPDKLILPSNWVDTHVTRRQFMKYLAEIRRLDNQVGDIVRLLKETGQDKNTIVVFLGEQGAQFPGAKWNLWDAGQKSAMMIRWPGVIKPGAKSEGLVQYEDITPTLIDIAGGKPIPGLDGRSFLPVLSDNYKEARKYVYGIHNNIPEGNAYAIRSIRDARFKLILNLSSDKPYYNRFMMDPQRRDRNSVWFSWVEEAHKNPQAKFITSRFETRPKVEFYDLTIDPFELKNLGGNPTYKTQIAAYKEKLEEWMIEQGDKGAAIDIVYSKKTE